MNEAQSEKQVDVSVIVVNYYSLDEMNQCIEHIQAGTFDGVVEILVVNNSPGDGTAQCMREQYPDVVYLEPGENLGFGRACNYGFERAGGKYMLLVNPDAYVAPEAIQNAYNYFEENEQVGVVGVRLTSETGGWHPSARGFPTLLDKLMMLAGLTSRFPQSRFFGRLDHTWWDHSHPKSVDWVVGAFFMIRTSACRKLEGFDPRFFIYFEEMEFCKRIKKMGMEVHFVPCAEVRHVGGASSTGEHIDEAAIEGKQISHFRMFSEALYYGKYYGRLGPTVMLGVEWSWTMLRYLRTKLSSSEEQKQKARALRTFARKIGFALKETRWGSKVPPQPWSASLEKYANWEE